MKIAIIGAGAVGSSLGSAWAKRGHDIVFGVRDVNKPALKSLCKDIGTSALPGPEAAAAGDIVVLALPWDGAEASIKALGDLSGKTVIDCTNPLGFEDGALFLDRGYTSSGGEAVASWLPGASVVKGLNQVPAEMMSDNSRLAGQPVQFIAGDDESAKATAKALIEELGFEVLDAGALVQSRILEPFGMVFINQALMRGMGRDWAFGILRNREEN